MIHGVGELRESPRYTVDDRLSVEIDQAYLLGLARQFCQIDIVQVPSPEDTNSRVGELRGARGVED